MREQIFEPAMFGGEGAWDILLVLYSAAEQGRQHTRVSLASEVGLPRSLLDRWLRYLEQSGMVHAPSSTSVMRFSAIDLTERGRDRLYRYFDLVVAAALAAQSGRAARNP